MTELIQLQTKGLKEFPLSCTLVEFQEEDDGQEKWSLIILLKEKERKTQGHWKGQLTSFFFGRQEIIKSRRINAYLYLTSYSPDDMTLARDVFRSTAHVTEVDVSAGRYSTTTAGAPALGDCEPGGHAAGLVVGQASAVVAVLEFQCLQ